MIYKLSLYLCVILVVAACSPKTSNKTTQSTATQEQEQEQEQEATSDIPEYEVPNNSSANFDTEQFAKEMCHCSNDVATTVSKVTALTEEDAVKHKKEIEKLSNSLATKLRDMEVCIVEMEKRYPDLNMDKETEAQVMSAMRKQCPDVVKLMESE